MDIEKTTLLKMPTEKEAAEATIKIGGGLIERKHLEKWIKRLKFKENMDILKNLFVDNNQTIYRKTYITLIVEVNLWKKKNQRR